MRYVRKMILAHEKMDYQQEQRALKPANAAPALLDVSANTVKALHTNESDAAVSYCWKGALKKSRRSKARDR